MARQLEMAQEVCTANGWQLVDLPPDEGVSAYKVDGENGLLAANMHKGNLATFLARVENGEIKKGSVLIIEKLDRFSRNYYDIVFPVWLNLLQSGIEIYSCVSNVHYTLESIRKNPMLAGMALIEMANANEYSSGMANRIGKAFSLRLAQCAKGKKMNLGNWQPGWVDFKGERGQEGEFSLNAHAATIRRIVAEYVGGASMISIAKGLNRDGVTTRLGNKWAQATVEKILKDEALIGGKTIKGVKLHQFFPPVISHDQWVQLQARLADNKDRKGGSPRSDRIVNLFRNRCRCAKCAGALRGHSDRYHCFGVTMGTCDARGTVKIAALEMDFFMLFLQEHPAVLLGKQTVKSNGEVSHLKARIRDLDKSLEDATNLIGKLPIKALETKLTALAKERETAAQHLEAVNLKMLSSAFAPAAFDSIKETLSGFAKLGENYIGSKEERQVLKAIEQLRKQLADNEIRKKLLNLLPSLVSHLVIDTEKKRYRIVNHAGEMSEWRQVAR